MNETSKRAPVERIVSYQQRKAWLLEQIAHQHSVDILNADLVASYADFTGAKYRPSIYGAGWCGLLSRDLARMTKARLLTRARVGLSAYNGGSGFPRWVYSYRLSGIGKEQIVRGHTPRPSAAPPTCDQYVLDGFAGVRKCANKPAAGDVLCKRHRATAQKSGYAAGHK